MCIGAVASRSEQPASHSPAPHTPQHPTPHTLPRGTHSTPHHARYRRVHRWAPLTELWHEPLPTAPVASSYDAAVARCLAAMAQGDLRGQRGGGAIRLLGMRLAAIAGPADVPTPTGASPRLRHSRPLSAHLASRGAISRPPPPRGYVTPDLRYAALPGKLAETIATAAAVVSRPESGRVHAILAGALRIAEEASDESRRAYDAIAAAALPHLSAQLEGRARVLASPVDEWGGGEWAGGGRSADGSLSGDSADALAWLNGDSLLGRLLDRWLEPAELRDERVAALCHARADAPLLLFFGERFRRHLLRSRQDLLHMALQALTPPPSEAADGPVEFYHYERPEHSLTRLLSALRVEGRYAAASSADGVAHLTTWMLHRETQALVVAHTPPACSEAAVLRVLPRLEFADVAPRISSLFAALPREQTAAAPQPGVAAPPLDGGGQGHNDAADAIHAKFAALCASAPPLPTDAVAPRTIDEVVLALGRADDASMSMRVLSRHASASRGAREALSATLPKLSRPLARSVLVDIIVARETKLSARVAMLRMALELQLPNALDTCVAAYRQGACHRDVHTTILARLAATPGLVSIDAEAALIRPLFASVASRSAEDGAYICQTTLGEITGKPWHVPFLVELVGSSWAYVPEVAPVAYRALCSAHGPAVDAASLVRALAALLSAARILVLPVNAQLVGLADPRHQKVPAGSAQLQPMHALWADVNPRGVDWCAVLGRGHQRDPKAEARRAALGRCDAVPLRELVGELLSWAAEEASSRHHVTGFDEWSAGSPLPENFEHALQVFALLLRSEADAPQVDWMAARLRMLGKPPAGGADGGGGRPTVAALLRALAKTAVERAHELCERRSGAATANNAEGSGATCDSPAFRAVELAREAVPLASDEGVALLLDCSARLLGSHTTAARAAELGALFAAVQAEEMQAFLRMRASQGQGLNLEARLATALFDGPHCWAALRWLAGSSACSLPPRSGLDALATLGARAALLGPLQPALDLFSAHHDAAEWCARFVELVAESPHGLTHLPAALSWLSPILPQAAAALFPRLLAQNPSAHAEELLNLCTTHGVRLPPLTPAIVQGAAHVLRGSPLAEARVQAAHALAAAHDVDAMHAMLKDPCAAVAAVARHNLLGWGLLQRQPPKRQLSGEASGQPPLRSHQPSFGSDSAMPGSSSNGDEDEDEVFEEIGEVTHAFERMPN